MASPTIFKKKTTAPSFLSMIAGFLFLTLFSQTIFAQNFNFTFQMKGKEPLSLSIKAPSWSEAHQRASEICITHFTNQQANLHSSNNPKLVPAKTEAHNSHGQKIAIEDQDTLDLLLNTCVNPIQRPLPPEANPSQT